MPKVKRRALFLDRDGVINIDYGYVFRPADFQVIDGVFDVLRRAQASDYALIVVTNQSGIARGLFSSDDYRQLENHMRKIFTAEGISFTAIYHCPHHPEGIVPAFTQSCICRKPQPGMILQAAREHNIDLARSVMIGDKKSDLEAACAAGIIDFHFVKWPERRISETFFMI